MPFSVFGKWIRRSSTVFFDWPRAMMPTVARLWVLASHSSHLWWGTSGRRSFWWWFHSLLFCYFLASESFCFTHSRTHRHPRQEEYQFFRDMWWVDMKSIQLICSCSSQHSLLCITRSCDEPWASYTEKWSDTAMYPLNVQEDRII